MSKWIVLEQRRIAWLFLAAMTVVLAACTESMDSKVGSSSPRNIVPGSPPSTAQTFEPGAYKVGKPYQIGEQWYYPKVDVAYQETGIASWYGPNFHGRKTANGERFDMSLISAAHRTLPMPSVVRVTNLENGRSLIVRINDRGPFARGRIIDLSRRAAELLGFTSQGTALVQVRLMVDESREAALAAGATAQDMAAFGAPPPKASPSVEVSVERLPTVEGEALGAASTPATVSSPARQASAPSRAPTDETGLVAGYSPPPFGAMTAVAEATDETAPATLAAETPTAPAIVDEQAVAEPINVEDLPKREKVERVEIDHRPHIFIQAGAFRQFVNANRLRARLSALGHPVNVSQVYVTNQPFFRVRMGPLKSVEDADRALERLVSLGYPEARIVID